TAISFAQKNISWTSFEKKDILNIILSCVVGVIPSFMIVVYSIYDLKFNRFKKDII
ncbi:glycosyltransferase domain protein, partial [Bacteroides fragilis str. 3998 T(B) 4]